MILASLTFKLQPCTYLFISNGTLYYSNKIKSNEHIDLILSGSHMDVKHT